MLLSFYGVTKSGLEFEIAECLWPTNELVDTWVQLLNTVLQREGVAFHHRLGLPIPGEHAMQLFSIFCHIYSAVLIRKMVQVFLVIMQITYQLLCWSLFCLAADGYKFAAVAACAGVCNHSRGTLCAQGWIRIFTLDLSTSLIVVIHVCLTVVCCGHWITLVFFLVVTGPGDR